MVLQSPTCAAAPSKYLRSARSRVHYVTSDMTAYCKVQARVPTPPSPIINLIYSNSKHSPPAPPAPKYWVIKGP